MSASSTSVTSSTAKTFYCNSTDEKKVHLWMAVEKMFRTLASYPLSIRYNSEGTYTLVDSAKISAETIEKMLGDNYEEWDLEIVKTEANGDHVVAFVAKKNLVDIVLFGDKACKKNRTYEPLTSVSSQELSNLTYLCTEKDKRKIRMLNAVNKVLIFIAKKNEEKISSDEEKNSNLEKFKTVHSFKYLYVGKYKMVGHFKGKIVADDKYSGQPLLTDYGEIRLFQNENTLSFCDKEDLSTSVRETAENVASTWWGAALVSMVCTAILRMGKKS